MTTVVYFNGTLAADTRVTHSDGGTIDSRNIKLHKIDGIDHLGVPVTWVGCSGTVAHSDALRRLLDEREGSLTDVLNDIRYNIGSINLSALFLLADGNGLHLHFDKSKTGINVLVLDNLANEFKAIGSGRNYAESVRKIYRLKTAAKVVFMASRLDNRSGGVTHYVKPDNVRVFTMTRLSEATKVSLRERFETMIGG